MSGGQRHATSWRDHALGFALCVAYVAVLLATSADIGMSRDEGIYVGAAQSYGGWVELLFRDPKRALEQSSIDQAFRVNREHPPLMKVLFGLGFLAQQKWQLFASESDSYRFAGMLTAGLLVWLIYIFGTRLYGRGAGVLAALLYAALPRPFYHAHLNAFDVPITLANTAVVYAYWRSLTARRWALACGALFGLALLTKHNSWVLPGIFGIHFGMVAWLERRVRADGGARRIELVPRAIIACFTIGPLLFFAGWPFLWHETFQRLGWYAGFHLDHEYYNMEYFGVNYFWPPFPMSYAWVMTLFTVPLTTLALGVSGFSIEVRALIAAYRAPAAKRWENLDPTLTTVLLLGAMFAPLVIITVPTTPIFGGTKHWFPAYPFLALLAGVGFDRAVTVYAAWLQRSRARRLLAFLPWPAGALLLLPALVETAHSHPFALSHYGFAAGFVPGAADRGMNRQFWGFTTRSLTGFFYERLPAGGRVWICDTIDIAFRMLARDGHLPANIVPTVDIAAADYAIVHHEHHFAEVDHQIWTAYGTTRPAHVLTYDGVPIISVYENPARRRAPP